MQVYSVKTVNGVMEYCDEGGKEVPPEKKPWCMEPPLEKQIRELVARVEKLEADAKAQEKRIRELEMRS